MPAILNIGVPVYYAHYDESKPIVLRLCPDPVDTFGACASAPATSGVPKIRGAILGVPTIMENQMEKKIENEMETGIYKGTCAPNTSAWMS